MTIPNLDNPTVLKRGSLGDEVKKLQSLLNEVGILPASKINSVFGASTEVAVKQFQREHSLTVDGLAGPLTTRALLQREGE